MGDYEMKSLDFSIRLYMNVCFTNLTVGASFIHGNCEQAMHFF